MKKNIIIILVILLTFSEIIFGRNLPKFGISLGYPYVSLKYRLSSKFTTELRDTFSEGINVVSLRGYYDFYKINKISCFTGIDLGYVFFDTDDVKGEGSLFTVFIGGEYFVSSKISISIDIGPSFITLWSKKEKDLSVSGIEWILNSGLNIYFGKDNSQ